MTEITLSQTDADSLLALEKHRVLDAAYNYPGLGGSLQIPLQSEDKRENFILDISRAQINIAKGKYQNRAKGVIILARIDFGGALHRNPDEQEIPCPHMHLYREGYGDKWAVPLLPSNFPNVDDRWVLLQDFMRFVNIVSVPTINRGLFI